MSECEFTKMGERLNVGIADIDRSRIKCGMTEGSCNDAKQHNVTHLFSYSPIHLFTFKKVAFTLSEVLITLGIIGVVAAITLPTLIANHRGVEYKTQFKKTLSVLSQAGKMSRALYDFSYVDTTGTCDDGTENVESSHSICAIINSTLNSPKYLGLNIEDYQVVGSVKNGAAERVTAGWTHSFLLPDGAYIGIFRQHSYCSKKSPCYGYIDVNGKKPPNKEISCSDGNSTLEIDNANYVPCKVDKNAITDFYPVYFIEDSVVPATNAAADVLGQ